MATEKQLAALKKGRETRAKKLAAGLAPKRTKAKSKKVYAKNPIKKIFAKYIVQVKARGNKIGYLKSSGELDTLPEAAAKYALKSAEVKATHFFNANKALLLWVKVIDAPKH